MGIEVSRPTSMRLRHRLHPNRFEASSFGLSRLAQPRRLVRSASCWKPASARTVREPGRTSATASPASCSTAGRGIADPICGGARCPWAGWQLILPVDWRISRNLACSIWASLPRERTGPAARQPLRFCCRCGAEPARIQETPQQPSSRVVAILATAPKPLLWRYPPNEKLKLEKELVASPLRPYRSSKLSGPMRLLTPIAWPRLGGAADKARVSVVAMGG